MSFYRQVFVYPLTALINIFVHIIQSPGASTADSDMSLMHLVAGHFSNLEFSVPQMNFPFVRQLAGLALKTVTASRAVDTASRMTDQLPELTDWIAFNAISPTRQVGHLERVRLN